MSRECATCTECCRGHLACTVLGHELRKGQPCHFVGETGCTVYEMRPEAPCRTYLCAWRQDAELPTWFRPDLSGIIVTKRPYGDGKHFWDVQETRPMEARYLIWLMARYHKGQAMRIWIEGGSHTFGPEEFHASLAAMALQGVRIPAA